jgi:hypothetical protein
VLGESFDGNVPSIWAPDSNTIYFNQGIHHNQLLSVNVIAHGQTGQQSDASQTVRRRAVSSSSTINPTTPTVLRCHR